MAEQIGQMRLVDRTTLGAVVDEFLNELEQVGLSFPGGIEGALSMMDGHISSSAASRLRRLAGAGAKADPWDRITSLTTDLLLPVSGGRKRRGGRRDAFQTAGAQSGRAFGQIAG